ncbi:integrase, partial [Methylobacterium sp. WL64]
MSGLPAVIEPVEALPPAQADDDAQMVRLWLSRSSSPNTRRNYEREARRFLVHVGKPLG